MKAILGVIVFLLIPYVLGVSQCSGTICVEYNVSLNHVYTFAEVEKGQAISSSGIVLSPEEKEFRNAITEGGKMTFEFLDMLVIILALILVGYYMFRKKRNE